MLHHRFLFLTLVSVVFINLAFCMEQDENETGQSRNICNPEILDQDRWRHSIDWREKEEHEHTLIQEHSKLYEQNSGALPYINNIESIDPFLVEQLIQSSPLKLQRIINALKNKRKNNSLERRRIPNKMVFLGKPGTGKSSLAQAIALYCNIPGTFVKVAAIHNEYKDSGSSAINSICSRIRKTEHMHIIIFDELQCLIKRRNNKEFDIDVAQTFWSMLDDFKRNPNIFIIGTANKITDLPKPLINRFGKAVYEIGIPSSESREKIIRYYLSRLPMCVLVNFEDHEIKQIVNDTKNCVGRDLENIIEEASDQVCFEENDFLDENELVLLKLGNIKSAIKIIKKNNGVLTWQGRLFKKYFKQNAGIILKIGIPFAINLIFNCCMQQIALREQLYQSNLNHQTSMELSKIHFKMSMDQTAEFQVQQRRDSDYHAFDSVKSNVFMSMAMPLYASTVALFVSGNPFCLLTAGLAVSTTCAALIPSKLVTSLNDFPITSYIGEETGVSAKIILLSIFQYYTNKY